MYKYQKAGKNKKSKSLKVNFNSAKDQTFVLHAFKIHTLTQNYITSLHSTFVISYLAFPNNFLYPVVSSNPFLSFFFLARSYYIALACMNLTMKIRLAPNSVWLYPRNTQIKGMLPCLACQPISHCSRENTSELHTLYDRSLAMHYITLPFTTWFRFGLCLLLFTHPFPISLLCHSVPRLCSVSTSLLLLSFHTYFLHLLFPVIIHL